ncbi:MAG: DsrE family protein [Promethearchaeota archaeon]
MGKIGMLFFSGPHQSQAPETVIELANAALDKGHEVQIFCYMDAVNVVLENQKKVEGIFDVEGGFQKIVEKGALIRLCSLCLLVRGTSKNCMKCKDAKGKIKKAGTPDMEKILKETDKFLVIC